MITLIIYILGIFITPIILKKFFSEENIDYEIIPIICFIWPLSLVVYIILKILSFTVWIYYRV